MIDEVLIKKESEKIIAYEILFIKSLKVYAETNRGILSEDKEKNMLDFVRRLFDNELDYLKNNVSEYMELYGERL